MSNSASIQPIFMEDNHHLSHPLLPLPTIKHDQTQNFSSSNSSIIIRLFTLLFIGILSIWANFAASRAFDITIINDVHHFPARNLFNIFYISDDKATRIIENTTSFIQNILYYYPNNKNKIRHVTLRLVATAATTNFTTVTATTTDGAHHQLLINVSLSQMGDLRKLDYAVKSMVLEGMARIWVSGSRAPPWVLDGVVGYVKRVAGYGDEGKSYGDFWLADKDPRILAHILQHCESIRKGFIQRLIEDLRNGWDDQTVENALRLPIENVCDKFTVRHISS